jgi:hypothetical protein
MAVLGVTHFTLLAGMSTAALPRLLRAPLQYSTARDYAVRRFKGVISSTKMSDESDNVR